MKILIAGGGTAGHINPGLAIAKYVKKKTNDVEIVFVGTEKGLETKLIPREGFKLELINVRGFKRKVSMDTLIAMKEVFQGIHQSKKLIRRFKPDVVIGTGGYVCGPVLFVASRLGIPTLIHEPNAFPGITNKILSKFVDVVAVSFKEATEYFKSSKKLVLTGNPIREELTIRNKNVAKEQLNIKNNKPLIVIFGGSRGAKNINETLAKLINKYQANTEFNIIFATGEAQYDGILQQIDNKENELIRIVPYIFNMDIVMAAADLLVTRAGAITISEITALGVPSILIPSPYVTANHQEYNARVLEDNGASVIILEKDLNEDILYNQITELLKDKNLLEKMAQSSKRMGILNATEKIYEIIEELTKSK